MRVALLAALLLLPAALAGNADDYGAGFQDLTGYNTMRKMTRAANGALHYVWTEPTPDGETRVTVVRVHPDGREETLPHPRAAGGNATRPSLALDSQGRLHVAWTERAEDDREVFWARYHDGAWVDATQLSGGRGYAGFPSLAADGLGHVHVAWYGFDGVNYQTYYREWDGASWSPARQLSSGTLDANNPSVVVDPENGVHVAWYKDDGRKYRAWYAHKRAGGDWALPSAISVGEGDALNVALAVDRAGVVHATWDELHADGYRILHRALPDGPIGVLARGADAGQYPAIAAWGDGVLVAWSSVDGRLLASNGTGEPRPLLGGERGRLPSLRGPASWPEAERADVLDVLWTAPGPEVRRASLREGCSPFEPAAACPPPVPADDAPVPAPGVALAALAALAALSRRRRRAS